ncbi:MAG: ATP:cob(I)alamin adenosyltransferase, partial [Candidatus Izemoplasmatales bacterium]|nr:ATP:cob(I)alamin adenosyltransferase [Candidatus Izemoplasmatales bacterium]
MPIDKLKHIATKYGDSGLSKNFENKSFKKTHILFETLGTMDELSSYLGLCFHYCKLDFLKTIQINIQNINSLIASEYNSDLYNIITQIKDEDVIILEDMIQVHLDSKPLEARFYLPGSEKTEAGAYVDIARTFARKAERKINAFVEHEQREDLETAKKYLNRLSDYLF